MADTKERLIRLIQDAVKGCARNWAEIIAENLIANGTILLPCKFQQKVYVLPTIENNLSKMTEMKCIGFSLSCDSYVVDLITDKNKLYQPCFGRFGKTVFLTKEEAEKALEEREE